MSIRVHIAGRVCAPEDAKISVFDRGFLYGDSVYETIATHEGRLFALQEHLDRLERSAARLLLPLPPRAAIERAVHETVAAAANPESRVRIIVTRGEGKMDLDPSSFETPNLVVIVQPRGGPDPSLYESGVAVEIVSVTRNIPGAVDPAIKSGNYLNNVLALAEARRRNPAAHEAILLAANGSVAEGASSNVFAVVDGQLRTPATDVGILAGVTRSKVLALAQARGIACAEVAFMSADELRGAAEVFLTSAARGILPVNAVDGQPVAAPGPITGALMGLYRDLVRRS